MDTATIDKHPLLAGGMLGAVDVLGYVDQGVEVCYHNVGSLVFLDHSVWPPIPSLLKTYTDGDGLTCGVANRVGTVVLAAERSEAESLVRLSSCQITTRQTVRLRDEVAGSFTKGLVPYNMRLRALARTPNWFQVDFLGAEGWVSASYVDAEGICE